MVPHYFILKKIESLHEVDGDLVTSRFGMILFVELMVQVGHYLKQRDLATVVIRKHMLEKSQSHFQNYMQNATDPIYIVDQ